MFNIYKEEGEEMTENAKLREHFKRTKHPQLVESVKVLEVRYDMDGLTYTQAANHLTAAVSKLPDYQMARRVLNAKTGTRQGSKPTRVRRDGNTIYATNGTIWTGHYDEWATMKDSDKEKITAERECKKKVCTGKGSKGKNYKQKVANTTSLTEDIQAMKRSVTELISKRNEPDDWAQMSLQNACMYNVMSRASNFVLWNPSWITSCLMMQFRRKICTSCCKEDNT